MQMITDYHQIKNEFDRLYHEITSQEFKAKVEILGTPKIYKYTSESPAALRRGFLWMLPKIWIREMPEHEMFYELSHEAGHSAKPYYEKRSLDAEEIKACLYQYLLSKKIKIEKPEWWGDFVSFETFRRDQILRRDPKYSEYHEAAKMIANFTDHDFTKGTEYINSILEKCCL